MSRTQYRTHNASFQTDDSDSNDTIHSNMNDQHRIDTDAIRTIDTQIIHVTTTPPTTLTTTTTTARNTQHINAQVRINTQQTQPPTTTTVTYTRPTVTSPVQTQPITMTDLVNVIRSEIAQAMPHTRQIIAPNINTHPPHSSHNGDTRRNRAASLQSLNNLMTGLQLADTPTLTRPHRLEPTPPTYIPAHEQALRIHKQDVTTHQTTSGFLGKIAEFMNYTLHANPDMPDAAIDITKQILEQAKHSNQTANLKLEGLDRASKVVNYYETPITKPIYPDRDLHDHIHPVQFNLRELLMVTGYFDPSDKDSDFKHTWQKLLDYGTLGNFEENHYLQALSAILKKEAYETFTEFRSTGRSLDEILDYFAKVYTKKRSLIADRQAVDKFTRHKNESILVCMDRCIIAIDKLRHLYPAQGWPDMRQQMRRNILMQVIKEDTKRHIQMEEDDITESTGMPYDFDKLIRLADRYERHHNAAPKDEVSTLFKVASGGLHTKPPNADKSLEQLTHLKKDQMLQKKLDTLQAQIETLTANNVRPYKNDDRTDRARQARRQDRSDSQKRARDTSMDRNRNLSADKSSPNKHTPTDTTKTTPTTTQTSYQPPNPYDRNRSRSPGYRSRSPPRRSQTPGSNQYVSFSRDNSRSRSNSQQRDRSRSRSQNRSSNYNYPPRSNSNNRTDATTTHGHKAIYITINGQSYLAQPHKSEN